MPTFIQPTTQVHLNNAKTAAPKYMNDFMDQTMRKHSLLNMMKEYGMIEYNAGDAATIYQIKVREHAVRTKVDTTRLTFENSDLFEQCEVDVRAYEASDILTEEQYKKNQGEGRLINLMDAKMKGMVSTLWRRMNEYLYHDGDLAAYLDGFRGLESCLADDGATVVGDRVAAPSDTYAGLSTALGNFGGTWSTDLASADQYNTTLANDWPNGKGSNGSYDANSPLLINWSSTAWGTSSNLWDDNLEIVLREAQAIQKIRCGDINAPIFFIMPSMMYTKAENFYSQRHRHYAPFGGEQGYSEQNLMVDGVVLRVDYGVPANTVYGVCPDHIEAFFFPPMNRGGSGAEVGDEAFIDAFGPTWDEASGAYLMRADVYGNFRMYPKYLVKMKNYASA